MIREVLQGIREVRGNCGLPYREICKEVGVSYSSYERWRSRERELEPVVRRPGPHKVEPFQTGSLVEQIRYLGHRRKLSYGSGELYRQYASLISRRDFQELVRRVRDEANKEYRRHMKRIKWHVPGLVWGMDDLENEQRDSEGGKMYANRVQDLASQYKFSSLAGDYPCGEGIAGYLEDKFEQFGAPLFLKRDNRGNLNHRAVNEVLQRYFVIPLNSPRYYAPYNGSMERSQREFKEGLRQKLWPDTTCLREDFQAYAESVEHELNHRPRASLNGKTSCQVFFDGKGKVKFTKKERRKVYDWTKALAGDILTRIEDFSQSAVETAWRIAVETWLRRNGFISVIINGKVLPYFPPNSVS